MAGSPANLWRQYRREVELQLRATRHLLERELNPESRLGSRHHGKDF
jgi:hypothetical protein